MASLKHAVVLADRPYAMSTGAQHDDRPLAPRRSRSAFGGLANTAASSGASRPGRTASLRGYQVEGEPDEEQRAKLEANLSRRLQEAYDALRELPDDKALKALAATCAYLLSDEEMVARAYAQYVAGAPGTRRCSRRSTMISGRSSSSPCRRSSGT